VNMKGEEKHRERVPQSSMAQVVERNIEALLARRKDELEQQGLQERTAGAITSFVGSMRFVYIHVLFFGSWIAINLGWLPVPKFDPTFVVLAMVASVEAIFLSTFVLITQNRMQAAAERRAELELQINLLAEHEITRLISMVTELSKRMGIEAANDPELKELAQDVHPEKVLDKIEEHEKKAVEQSSS
jgi:uncharacterized membrane protein